MMEEAVPHVLLLGSSTAGMCVGMALKTNPPAASIDF